MNDMDRSTHIVWIDDMPIATEPEPDGYRIGATMNGRVQIIDPAGHIVGWFTRSTASEVFGIH